MKSATDVVREVAEQIVRLVDGGEILEGRMQRMLRQRARADDAL